MRLTIDEYCKYFKMSKEMVNSKIKSKKLNYIIENGITYMIVAKSSLNKYEGPQEKKSVPQEPSQALKPRTTVATVIALYQKENSFLKNKIVQLEAKIDKLIDDKEQMLRDERDKIENLYTTKDEQLKNILELINNKMRLEREESTVHQVESFQHSDEAEIKYDTRIVELKEYLKSLGISSSQRKAIKKRFLDVYDSDVRIIKQNGKLYLDFSKYDYSDLLA
ncbi:MAG: hypothetical protein OQK48_09105 [Sulfurimonas sp.]|uniref:hypothetical protein n=1 Tax=Sulfurimonas sp. TaxID=2022749 RepID=UPI0026050117|nr:hypothetical protein [Sulfurimonas sp.]MCW8895973.1 hypothetical protein [Sulfurimonas sp.]MCW8955082.1 hypothetical protein [Sulfurimonas sp.]MCW9067018.1 hypothetical protein [Sulfurimonas sp.]